MTKCEGLKFLFKYLEEEKNLVKHCNDNSTWSMDEQLLQVVLDATKKIVIQSNNVNLNCDEVTNLDNQFNVHVYVV